MRKFWIVILAAGLLAAAPRLRAAERVNVVVIVADDLGWADLGCYGSKFTRRQTSTNSPPRDALHRRLCRRTGLLADAGRPTHRQISRPAEPNRLAARQTRPPGPETAPPR